MNESWVKSESIEIDEFWNGDEIGNDENKTNGDDYVSFSISLTTYLLDAWSCRMDC